MFNARMDIPIPRERLTIRFARSGGPGGQNVNKVETKAEIRFRLDEADWIPEDLRRRLRFVAAARINKDGELVISSSRFRSQARNLDDCFRKLRSELEEAGRVPKRRLPTRPGKASRRKRLEGKRRRGERKRERSWKPED
jgi:ribosome-associated protein